MKAGTAPADQRADELAAALLTVVARDDVRKAQELFRTSEKRAQNLSPEALQFIATAEYVAGQLEAAPQLEWSPAVIGLCKALETEVVGRILRPLAVVASRENLSDDKADKDFGRVAAFCADSNRKPPELGVFAHFLQTLIHSQQRRYNSAIARSFQILAGRWHGSNWVLDLNGLYRAISTVSTRFRNRAAHIEELGKRDYIECREFVAGAEGVLWKLIVSTEEAK